MNVDEQLLISRFGHDITRLTPTTKTVTGSDPAADTEATFGTVPTGKVWVLLSASIECAQGATQTPLPSLVIDDGTNILARIPACTAAISASTTAQCTWAVGLTTITAGAGLVANFAPLPNPGLVLPAAYRVRTVTSGKGANTNFGAGTLLVVEYA
jgi:hypothetical protein